MSKPIVGEEVDYKRVLWLKQVGLPGRWAYEEYQPYDHSGGKFLLHWPKHSRKYPAKPRIGDVIVLKQRPGRQGMLSHLVIPVSASVIDDPDNSRWPFAREVICLKKWDCSNAPIVSKVFPFSLKGGAAGNGVSLESYIRNRPGITTLAELQKRIWRAFFPTLSPAQISFDINGVDFETHPEEVADPSRYVEGATRTVSVDVYERSALARSACLAYYGYVCVVCGFDFEVSYGELGKGFIHVHHLKSLAALDQEYVVDPIKDLRPVCPNCHAMLHKVDPPMSVEKLRQLVQKRR